MFSTTRQLGISGAAEHPIQSAQQDTIAGIAGPAPSEGRENRSEESRERESRTGGGRPCPQARIKYA